MSSKYEEQFEKCSTFLKFFDNVSELTEYKYEFHLNHFCIVAKLAALYAVSSSKVSFKIHINIGKICVYGRNSKNMFKKLFLKKCIILVKFLFVYD